MKKVLIFALFFFLVPRAHANDILSREHLSFPLYVETPKEQTLAASAQGMRLGCIATARGDADLAACRSLADKLCRLVETARQEALYADIMGSHLPPKEHEHIRAVIGQKILQMEQAQTRLLSRFPYVQFYISPGVRLDI